MRESDLWERWKTILSQRDPDPLEVARLAAMFERYFDAVKTEAVKAARASGCSWEDVGDAVGTTRQSAWERYRRMHPTARRFSKLLSALSLPDSPGPLPPLGDV